MIHFFVIDFCSRWKIIKTDLFTVPFMKLYDRYHSMWYVFSFHRIKKVWIVHIFGKKFWNMHSLTQFEHSQLKVDTQSVTTKYQVYIRTYIFNN